MLDLEETLKYGGNSGFIISPCSKKKITLLLTTILGFHIEIIQLIINLINILFLSFIMV